jgi:hypothetical protein
MYTLDHSLCLLLLYMMTIGARLAFAALYPRQCRFVALWHYGIWVMVAEFLIKKIILRIHKPRLV